MLDGGETVEIAWGELRWEGARQHAGLRGFDTEKSFAQNKTLLLCKTSSVCKSLCRAEKMNFAVNAPIIFIFQKGAGKRRKGNPPAPKVLGRDRPGGTRKRLQVYGHFSAKTSCF